MLGEHLILNSPTQMTWFRTNVLLLLIPNVQNSVPLILIYRIIYL